jgi:hypothetical protein
LRSQSRQQPRQHQTTRLRQRFGHGSRGTTELVRVLEQLAARKSGPECAVATLTLTSNSPATQGEGCASDIPLLLVLSDAADRKQTQKHAVTRRIKQRQKQHVLCRCRFSRVRICRCSACMSRSASPSCSTDVVSGARLPKSNGRIVSLAPHHSNTRPTDCSRSKLPISAGGSWFAS